jgi:hypothetical protein
MRILRLLVFTTLFPIAVCYAQTNVPKTKTQTTTKGKPTDTKAKKPKKAREPVDTGTKLHPEQERAYAQAYKTGAVSKP